MRLLWIIPVVACCTACQHPRQESVTPPSSPVARAPSVPWTWNPQFEGTSYQFDLPEAALFCKTKWDAEKGPPPLTPHQAGEIAKKEAARLRPDVPGWSCDRLDLIQADGRDSWFYVAYLIRGDFIMGLPEYFTIPVLMSGVALHPISVTSTRPTQSNAAQPANPAPVGQTVTFGVTSTNGGPLYYQWYFNGTNTSIVTNR